MKDSKHSLMQLAVLVGAFSLYGSAHAFNPQPEPPATPPVGMTANQTVVLYASVPPDPFAAAAVIQVQLGLFDASGELRLQLMADIAPGKIVSMEIAGDKLGIPAGGRMPVVGVVQCSGGPRATSRCAQSINASMELYETSTGMTSIVIPAAPAIVPVIF